MRTSAVEPWRVLRTRLRKSGVIPGSDEGGTPSGFFTGATGITVYRGDAWPAEYRGQLFVGEVANNLVYRTAGTQWHRPDRASSGPRCRVSCLDRQLVPTGAIHERSRRHVVRHRHVSRADRRSRIPRPGDPQAHGHERRSGQGSHLPHRPRRLSIQARDATRRSADDGTRQTLRAPERLASRHRFATDLSTPRQSCDCAVANWLRTRSRRWLELWRCIRCTACRRWSRN